MRRLWVSVALLALLAGLAWAHTAKLNGLTGELTELLTRTEAALRREDWDRAEAEAAQADALWASHAFYLHITLSHEDIDAIRASLKEMRAYLASRDDAAECLAVSARLRNQLELLAEAELPSLKNLL